jgi:hypothetical protein
MTLINSIGCVDFEGRLSENNDMDRYSDVPEFALDYGVFLGFVHLSVF